MLLLQVQPQGKTKEKKNQKTLAPGFISWSTACEFLVVGSLDNFALKMLFGPEFQ